MIRTANFVAATGKCLAVFLFGLGLSLILPPTWSPTWAPSVAAAAQEGAGQVIAAKQEAWARRVLTEAVLRSKSPVFTGDVVNTNPIGRLQILFRDNSALMMAPDSQVTINEYVYGEGEPAMTIGLAKGLTRFISGDIVRRKPGAMTVETPSAVAGIQGTIVVVEVRPGQMERFALTQISEGKELHVTLKNGQKLLLDRAGWELVLFPDGSHNFREIPAGDLNRLNGQLASSAEKTNSGEDRETVISPEYVLATGGTRESANSFMPLPLGPGGPWQDLNGPRDFAGSYNGAVSGLDGGIAWNGTFSVGISDIAGAFELSSVNVNHTSGGNAPFSIAGAGNLGSVSSSGGFSTVFNSGDPNWTSTGAWTAGDNVTISGQSNGRDLTLDLNGTLGLNPFTGSGAGQKP